MYAQHVIRCYFQKGGHTAVPAQHCDKKSCRRQKNSSNNYHADPVYLGPKNIHADSPTRGSLSIWPLQTSTIPMCSLPELVHKKTAMRSYSCCLRTQAVMEEKWGCLEGCFWASATSIEFKTQRTSAITETRLHNA